MVNTQHNDTLCSRPSLELVYYTDIVWIFVCNDTCWKQSCTVILLYSSGRWLGYVRWIIEELKLIGKVFIVVTCTQFTIIHCYVVLFLWNRFWRYFMNWSTTSYSKVFLHNTEENRVQPTMETFAVANTFGEFLERMGIRGVDR